MWAPVLNELGLRHRLVVPDVPGLGESQPLPQLDEDAFSKWLTGLIDATGLERPIVVAHSLIGSLTARVAARASDHIDQLVIYAAPGVGPYKMPWRLRYAAIRLAIRPTPRNLERFERFALLDLDANRRRDPEWFRAFEAYNLERARQRAVKKTMNRLVSTQVRPMSDHELERINIPMALLWGRYDRMVPLAIGQSASTKCGWLLHVIEHAAHAPHVEQPDAFVEALTTIVASDRP